MSSSETEIETSNETENVTSSETVKAITHTFRYMAKISLKLAGELKQCFEEGNDGRGVNTWEGYIKHSLHTGVRTTVYNLRVNANPETRPKKGDPGYPGPASAELVVDLIVGRNGFLRAWNAGSVSHLCPDIEREDVEGNEFYQQFMAAARGQGMILRLQEVREGFTRDVYDHPRDDNPAHTERYPAWLRFNFIPKEYDDSPANAPG